MYIQTKHLLTLYLFVVVAMIEVSNVPSAIPSSPAGTLMLCRGCARYFLIPLELTVSIVRDLGMTSLAITSTHNV